MGFQYRPVGTLNVFYKSIGSRFFGNFNSFISMVVTFFAIYNDVE